MADEANELSRAITVEADGHWPGVDARRLSVEGGLLFATMPDPQVDVDFEVPVTFVGVAIFCPGGYAGDKFTVYYSEESPPAFSEELSQTVGVRSGATVELLRFDGRVHHLRIDPMEKAGDTGIASIALVAGRDEEEVLRRLAEASSQGEAAIVTTDVIMDPARRDSLAAYASSAMASEARARKRLARPHPAAPGGAVDVVFDPKPNFLDPDAPLLRDDVMAIVERALGVRPRVRTDNLGEIRSADLTLCIAQTALSATMERVPWDLPAQMGDLRRLCFMAAGSAVLGMPGDHGFAPTRRTRAFLRLLFAGPWIHGVRDEYTAELLSDAGVSNYRVVGTPSLWDIPDDLGERIPRAKGARVVFAADEYFHDLKNDVATLKRLGRCYERVALWPRNLPEPLDYAKRLIALAGIEESATVLAPGVESLIASLLEEGTDYVGPNLEAGIKALKAGRRTLILSSDDRSTGIVRLAHLPSIRRIEAADALEDWILADHEVRLAIPRRAIDGWMGQFR